MDERLRSRKLQNASTFIVGIASIVLKKIVDAVDAPMLGRLWEHVFVEIWFVWLGAALAGLWWIGWEALKLLRDYKVLRDWISAGVPRGEAFHQWLRHQDEHGFQYTVRRSLDDRISTYLSWWEESGSFEQRVRGMVREEMKRGSTS